MRNRVLKVNLLLFVAITLGVSLFAQGGGAKVEPLTVAPETATAEAKFCTQYLDWLTHRAALDHFDQGWPKRLEQAKFAAKEHLKYLDEQPFLSTTAEAYHKFLKDLDAVQDRVLRWKQSGAKDPDYAEAVAGYLRKTIYDDRAELTPAMAKDDYFIARLKADTGYPIAEQAMDRKLLTSAYDLFVKAWSLVPSPAIYDAFRTDVLRKAVHMGRLSAQLAGDKVDRGFPASINAEDAKHLLQLCATLRELSPADADGEVRAAAAVGRWGIGDMNGAYSEILPILAMRKTDAGFGVFCARLASAMGKSEDALAWLQESARQGLSLMPTAELMTLNPDFATLRKEKPNEFKRMLYMIAALETVERTKGIAARIAAKPAELSDYKTLYEQIPMLADQKELRSHALCTVIAGLKYNGRLAGLDEMMKRLESYTPPQSLLSRIDLNSLMDACVKCNGSGIDLVKNERCRQCSGGGVCKFEYCKGGIRFSPFDRPGERRKPCGSCSGTGICRNCKGKGKLTCGVCEGEGRALSKAKTEAAVKSLAEETADLADEVLKGN